jgi:hypothetical protein
MLKHRGFLLLASFALFIIGFTALIMMLLGLNWSFLRWMDMFGRGFGMVLRLVLIAAGLVMYVIANTDWEKEKQENT